MSILKAIQKGMIDGDAEKVKTKTEEALNRGYCAEKIVKDGLIPVMNEIGKAFKNGDIFIPDVLMSSRAMHAGLYVLKPLLSNVQSEEEKPKGTIVIGTVAGDLHDIGKNLVAMCFRGEGYKVIDLGIDVPASGFVEAIWQHSPDVIAMSALLTTTIGEIRNAISAISEEGIRDDVRIIVGGGPVTPDFAEEVGADGYGDDIFDAIEVVNRILKKKSSVFQLN